MYVALMGDEENGKFIYEQRERAELCCMVSVDSTLEKDECPGDRHNKTKVTIAPKISKTYQIQ